MSKPTTHVLHPTENEILYGADVISAVFWRTDSANHRSVAFYNGSNVVKLSLTQLQAAAEMFAKLSEA